MSEDPCVTAQPVIHMTMISKIVLACRECVTQKDNLTHSPMKWSFVISLASVIAHDAFQLIHKTPVNVRDFALALAAVAAAHGIGINQAKDQ